MTREVLPNRRGADVLTFQHEERRWTATFSRFADGRIAEIFIDAPKQSPLADAAREGALVASLALQHGCPFETLRHALDGRDVSPLSAALALIEPPPGTAPKPAQPAAQSADLPLHIQRDGEP